MSRPTKPPRESKSKYDKAPLTEPNLRFLQKYGASWPDVIESRCGTMNERDHLGLPLEELKTHWWDIAGAFNRQTEHVLNGQSVDDPLNPANLGELKDRFNIAEQSLPGELKNTVPNVDAKFYPVLQKAYGWMADHLTMQVQRNLQSMAKET